jgi:hypothetical protein
MCSLNSTGTNYKASTKTKIQKTKTKQNTKQTILIIIIMMMTGSVTHPNFYSMGTGVLFPR